MSLAKYFGEAKDPQGAPLFWSPGETEDFPFRGIPPSMLSRDEMESIPVVFDAKIEVLTLPGDEVRYQEILDRCANGLWTLRFERIEWDVTKAHFHVLISWLEKYKQTPLNSTAWDATKQRLFSGEIDIND